MLRIIYGKAGGGKSAAIMREIGEAVSERLGGRILLVPEQYSHEAERELCTVCSDALSLYAEVLSFTGLARKLCAQLGGGATRYLDGAGKLLCMALAADSVSSRLKVYSSARHRAELQTMLLGAVDELKSACIDAERLELAAAECGGVLADKLRDLALVLEAYDAAAANGSADPADRLTELAEHIAESDFDEDTHIYIDGFTDFTAQEQRVIEEMLLKGCAVTVCLNCDELYGDNEVFALSRMTARRLMTFAQEHGIDCAARQLKESSKALELEYFADNMFSYRPARFEGESERVHIFTAPNIAGECELAAAKAVELVRETGCRWRDIAVAVRGFEDYRLPLESSFRRYGAPLYTARRSAIRSKPLPALMLGAYEIVSGGWEADDVISYLRTYLAGLDAGECDELENYVYKWQLRGSAWTQEQDWRLHPEGYGAEYTEETNEALKRINALRRAVSAPLARFDEKSAAAETAREQAQAICELLEELEVGKKLEERADRLAADGSAALAQEYAQLWDIVVNALEQAAAVLGDTQTDRDYFCRLLELMLSQYDVGSIPAALDGVTAGDFDRMRRRRIKHLIVLGVADSRLPASEDETGVFSSDERRQLLEHDIDLGGAGENELWREFSLIYNCLTLPSESLIMSYPEFDRAGESQRAAFPINRAMQMFDIKPAFADKSELALNARVPALEIAARPVCADTAHTAARAYFEHTEPDRLKRLDAAADLSRGSLSRDAVRALYGEKISLSASRIDKFASCRFAYFMQYGLKAKPREPAGFTPPELGTFMHFVLETVATAVSQRGGFKAVSDEELEKLTDQAVGSYIHDTLNDFREKSPRFEYLFRRLIKNVRRVVGDMAQELRASDFEPLSFELDFGKCSAIPPLELGDGEDKLRLTGVADRVDGWLHDGKLYLRVVDYKTGRKSFSLSDLLYGMGLQMLLYLFSLEKNGDKLYGHEIVPAGVLYIPARDVLLSSTGDMSDEELGQKRAAELKRSGLILGEPEVIQAMERGDEPRYLPVKFKGGVPSGDALASAEQFGLLSRHIERTLADMASQLRRGSIAADPYYRSQQENACLHCDYFAACHFADGENGESLRSAPRLAATRVWSVMEESDYA